MTDHIIKAAKEAGGTTYTNRHHDGTACAFGPEALERFWAIAFKAGMERAAEICESRQTPGTGSVAILNGAADAIRAHAQNQPKNEHDGSVVSKN